MVLGALAWTFVHGAAAADGNGPAPASKSSVGGSAAGADELKTSSHASDGRRTKAQRLKVAGWTMVGTGGALFVSGLIAGIVAPCDEGSGECRDEFQSQSEQFRGFGVMFAGFALGVGAGLPLLLRSRKLGAQRSVSIVAGPGSLMVRGRF